MKNYINIDEHYFNKKPIELESFNADENFFNDFQICLSQILKKKNFLHLAHALIFIFKEMATNANKANMKRVFFKLRDYVIDNPEDYEKGMEEFTEELSTDFKSIMSNLKNYNKYVKVIFEKSSGKEFVLRIKNNSIITKQEHERILSRLDKFKENKEVPEIVDYTEGAGLGFITIFFLLKKYGLNKECINFVFSKDKTEVKITVPLNVKKIVDDK